MERTTESWKFTLTQFIDRPDNDRAPHLVGQAPIANAIYDAAAWLGTVSQGRNTGDEYLSLALNSRAGVSQKVTIAFWQKKNRKTEADPHFKTREELGGRQLKFAAWIEPAGQFYQLRVLIEPFTANAGDLSESALEAHQQITNFVNKAKSQLPGGKQPELADAPKHAPENRKPDGKKKDRDLDVEPDDIPF